MSHPETLPVMAAPARPNKRRSRRKAPKGSTRARAFKNALGLGPNISLGVLDVSETGVRLLLREDLPQGQEFEVNLDSPSSRSVKLIAQVIWSVPAADGTFVVGASFLKSISYGDLQTLARM